MKPIGSLKEISSRAKSAIDRQAQHAVLHERDACAGDRFEHEVRQKRQHQKQNGVFVGALDHTIGRRQPGIAPGDAQRIFEPFFTTARETGGTGLGLSIARAIVTGAGGSIELLATEAGAGFRLVLPA